MQRGGKSITHKIIWDEIQSAGAGLQCKPQKKSKNADDNQFTCFDRKALLRIVESYNKKYEKPIKIQASMTDEDIWNAIRSGLQSSCGDQEFCWLDQPFLKNDSTIQGYYKPPKPKGRNSWLTTQDIDDVLIQYEKKYPHFVFMGAAPIDFEDVMDEYKNLNLCDFNTPNAKNQFGFVFNLDPHDESGSHWVSCFIDLSGKVKYANFFDSTGSPAPKQVDKFIRRLQAQVKKCMGTDLIYQCNTVQHQQRGSECGVYSLYFIYQSLEGYSFESITRTIILDDDVHKFRDFFFRPTIHAKK